MRPSTRSIAWGAKPGPSSVSTKEKAMSTVSPGAVPPESAVGRRDPKRAAMSGWIGSALEYYDFALYSQAAALVFPTVFFPSGNPTVAIISSLATYAVGYVARPIGAVVLGAFGDRRGRKNVLV